MGKWDLLFGASSECSGGAQQGLKSWSSDKTANLKSWSSDKSDPCPRSIDLPDIQLLIFIQSCLELGWCETT